jgi:hypothetical protein
MNPKILKLVEVMRKNGTPFSEALRRAFELVRSGKGFDEDGTVITRDIKACAGDCAVCPCKRGRLQDAAVTLS